MTVSDFKNFSQRYIKIIAYSILFLVYLIYYYDKFGYVYSDATFYIQNSIFVNPFYPLVVKLLGLIAGAENYKLITIIQFTIGFSILAYSCSLLAKIMNIIIFIEIFMLPFLMEFYIGGFGFYGTAIFTESFAYPLFILFFAIVLRLVVEKNPKDLNLALTLLGLIYALRTQLITLFPAMALVMMLLEMKNKPQYFAKLIATFLICFFFPLIYNYFYHGAFTSSKGSGFVISNNLIYLATEEDKNLFSDETTKQIFTGIYEKSVQLDALKYCDTSKMKDYDTQADIETNRIFFSFRKAPPIDKNNASTYVMVKQDMFDDAYKASLTSGKNCHSGDVPHYKSTSGARELATLNTFRKHNIKEWQEVDPILMNISTVLMKQHFGDWATLSSQVFLSYFGPEFIGPVVFSISMIIFITLSYRAIKGRIGTYSYYYLLIMLMMYANTVFLSFMAPPSGRYVIYNYALLAIFVFPLLQRLNEKLMKR